MINENCMKECRKMSEANQKWSAEEVNEIKERILVSFRNGHRP